MKKSENTLKEDVRVIRTLKKIEDAFFCLLQEKDYPEIKLQDIYKIAGINRSTFYRHFKDKEDLAVSIIKSKEERLKEILRAIPSSKAYVDLINNIYESILSDGNEIKLLLKLKGRFDFRLRCINILKENCLDTLTALGEERDSAKSSYVSALYADIIVESISWMLENGKEHKAMVVNVMEDIYNALGLRLAG